MKIVVRPHLRDFNLPRSVRFEDKRLAIHDFKAISLTLIAIDTK